MTRTEPKPVLLTSAYLAPVQYYTKIYAAPFVIEERTEPYAKQTYRNRCIIAGPQGPLPLTVPVEHDGTARRLTRDIRISDHGNWRHLHWTALVSAYRNSPYFEYYADDFRPLYERRFDFLVDFNEALRDVVTTLLEIRTEIKVNDGTSAVGTDDATTRDNRFRPAENYPYSTENYHRDRKNYPYLRKNYPYDSFSDHRENPQRGNTGQAQTAYDTSEDATRQWPEADDYRERIRPKTGYADDAHFRPVSYYQVFAPRTGFLPNLSIADLLFNMGPEARLTLRDSLVG